MGNSTLSTLLLAACAGVCAGGPPGEGWELVFHDEFNGRKLNWNVWMPEKGDRRDAFNDPDDSYLDGKGHLVLRVRKAKGGKYHVGFLRSRREFGHGYYEARYTLDTVPGYWSAFWLRGRESYNPDYSGAEVDIMEDPYRDDRVSLNIHQGEGATRKHEGRPAAIAGPRSAWHLFGCDWHESGFDFDVDGERAWETRTMTATAPNKICLTQELQFKSWAGDIRKSEGQLPAYWRVDYVRHYRRNPQAPYITVSELPRGAGKGTAVIRLTLANGTFAPRLRRDRWSAEDLPDGLTFAGVRRAGDTEAEVLLKGQARKPAQPAQGRVTVIAEPGEVAGSAVALIGSAQPAR